MKLAIITVLIGMAAVLSILFCAIYVAEIEAMLSSHPKEFFIISCCLLLVFAFWRFRVTYPEFRIDERIKWLIRKIKSSL
jgi:NADH:ubiquinone oxidoreductase subunit H